MLPIFSLKTTLNLSHIVITTSHSLYSIMGCFSFTEIFVGGLLKNVNLSHNIQNISHNFKN